MKFEMKKRILALALAGTTAFSVFGAAMSANAANWEVWYSGSSHVNAGDNAYYTHYDPAGYIEWSTDHVDQGKANVAEPVYSPDHTLQKDVPVDTAKSPLYVVPGTDLTGKEYADEVTVMKKNDGVYFTDLTDFMTQNGYATQQTTNGKFTIGTTAYTLYKTGTGVDTKYVTASDTWAATANGKKTLENYTAATDSLLIYYTPGYNLAEGADVLTNDYVNATPVSDDYGTTYGKDWTNAVTRVLDNYSKPYYIDGAAALGIASFTDMKFYDNRQPTTQVTVITHGAYDTAGQRTEAGYTTLSATSVSDIDTIMSTPVSEGVVYLYDYIENIPDTVSVSSFASAWANQNISSVLKDTTPDSGHINPMYGSLSENSRNIRGEIMLEWNDFLDDLGILDYKSADKLTAWAENTLDNYAFTYTDSSVITDVSYNPVTDVYTITFGGKVNLYKFDELIKDILYAATGDNADDMQSSELIYLIQQYNKYVDGGFVTENPAETDDWGDLLVSLASAPTEDEFRTSAAYKRYTGRADDLIEKYEEAATSAAVSMAEEDLYDFITGQDTWTGMTASATVDTTALYTSIDNTYFNANWARIGDSYAGGTDADGNLSTKDWNKNIQSNTDYGTAWALYPAGDYYGTSQGVYSGVDATKISNVTPEYKWFYSVFALAYDVYVGNIYQSTVDLMASTLDDAVDALSPYQNAYASEILAAEEQNDKLEALVETDYTASMWSNRNKINTYINDRVSNDEIGHNGSRNAADIAELTNKFMGWQKNQTVVTRSDINSLKDTLETAETALEALRNDEENYNAAQANALQKAIDECNVIIDLYNGKYGTNKYVQSINGEFNGATGDKDQILKSDITDATQAVEDAINFSNIIMGWSQDKDGNWMYGTEEGYLNDGWHQVDGGKTWFYFEENETAKQSEWWQDPATGTWYWFNSNCGAAVGWAKIDGDWYYFKGNNAMKTGWEKVEGSWYYMNSSGKMVTGWCQINGTWYYFSKESNALGQMLANTTTPDGYKVDANGALVE